MVLCNFVCAGEEPVFVVIEMPLPVLEGFILHCVVAKQLAIFISHDILRTMLSSGTVNAGDLSPVTHR